MVGDCVILHCPFYSLDILDLHAYLIAQRGKSFLLGFISISELSKDYFSSPTYIVYITRKVILLKKTLPKEGN